MQRDKEQELTSLRTMREAIDATSGLRERQDRAQRPASRVSGKRWEASWRRRRRAAIQGRKDLLPAARPARSLAGAAQVGAAQLRSTHEAAATRAVDVFDVYFAQPGHRFERRRYRSGKP